MGRKSLPNYSLPIGRVVVGGPIMSVLRLAFSQTQIMMTMQNMRHDFPPESVLKVKRERKL